MSLLQDHPFCRFCDQIREQAQDALLALKTRHDINIDLILFCYWFAANNQGLLSKARVKRLLSAIYMWQQKIVSPLNTLCYQLQEPTALDLWTPEDSAYEEAKKALKTAEQIEQLLLVEVLPKKSRRNQTSVIQAATHACVNVSNYCQSVYISLDETDYQSLSVLTCIAFPSMDSTKIISFVRSILVERHKQPLQKSLSFMMLYQ